VWPCPTYYTILHFAIHYPILALHTSITRYSPDKTICRSSFGGKKNKKKSTRYMKLFWKRQDLPDIWSGFGKRFWERKDDLQIVFCKTTLQIWEILLLHLPRKKTWEYMYMYICIDIYTYIYMYIFTNTLYRSGRSCCCIDRNGCMTDSTENATPLKSTISRNSHFSENCEFFWIYTNSNGRVASRKTWVSGSGAIRFIVQISLVKPIRAP